MTFGWPLLAVAAVGIAFYFGGLNAIVRAVRAAIPAVVALVFGLARRFLPVRVFPDNLSPDSLGVLNQRFRITQWIVSLAIVVVMIVFFWLTHHALVALNRGFAASEGRALFVLLPQTAI